ncbi:hypothetical protein ACFVWP_27385 [Streptomyces sp. NPDC058175]|uniref:imine reductase family protein n=1 Tax=Streptomyces sp. NPDC058175 TaxID=3346367 RepID=UPI0036EB54AF
MTRASRSAMCGMFNGAAHAFALIRKEGTTPVSLALLPADWLVATAQAVHQTADHLRSGRCTKRVVSYLGMQVAGTPTFLSTAGAQNVSPQLLSHCFEPMRHRRAENSARRSVGRDRGVRRQRDGERPMRCSGGS